MSKLKLAKPVWIALVAVGALCMILLLGMGISVIVGERGRTIRAQTGVTLSAGEVTVVTCAGRGIGKVELQSGKGVDGPLVWSASATGSSADTLPVRKHVAGFSIIANGVPLRSAQTYAIRGAYDSDGRSLIDSYIDFRPSALTPGVVTSADGKRLPIMNYLKHSATCP